MKSERLLILGIIAAALIALIWGIARRPAPAESAAAPDDPPAAETVRRERPSLMPRPRPAVTESADAASEEDPLGLRLSREQIEEHLAKNGRTAEGLLAAFEISGDNAFLLEAAGKHPTDPRVQLAVLVQDIFPEERAKWLEAFLQSDPANALPNYLAARHEFEQGNVEAAMKHLAAAEWKGTLDHYRLDALQNREETFLALGHSPAKAKMAAMTLFPAPTIEAQIKDVASRVAELHRQRATEGYEDAPALLRQGLHLSRLLSEGSGGHFLISQMVGTAIERSFLSQLDPGQPHPLLNRTPAERLAEMTQERELTRELMRAIAVLPTMNETDQMIYFDRMKLYGERNALLWLRDRQQQQP